MQEYYIRKSEDADARGPFSMEQLSSLAETGQVDLNTAYYDAEKEEWLPIGSNEPLKVALFPEKRKLRMKPKDAIPTLNPEPEAQAGAPKPISVVDMLDAAEGLTKDSKSAASQIAVVRERSAKSGLLLCAFALFLHAAALGVAERSVLLGPDLLQIFSRPLFYAAAADILLSFVLFLGVVEAYPTVRVRAAAMLGFMTIVLLNYGDPLLLVATALTSAGVYALTLLLDMRAVLAAGATAVAGAIWLGFQFLKY